MKKAFINWSSGKDAALAFYKIQTEKEYKIEKLFTTFSQTSGQVTLHQVPEELVEQQANSLGLPLHKVLLEDDISMKAYSDVIKAEFQKFVAEGFTHCLYGDIFLEDIREFREQQLSETGLKAVFPLWKINTKELMLYFIAQGFKAVVVTVDAAVLDKSFCGRLVDGSFLEDLPSQVDPCGENGEFHTFVFDGPIFRFPVNFRIGEMYERHTAKSVGWSTHFYHLNLCAK